MRLGRRSGRDPDGAALPLERLAGPGPAHHVDVLLEQLAPPLPVDAGHLELLLAVAEAGDDRDAPAAGEVEHGDLLGQPHGVVQRDQQGRDVHHRLARAPEDRARHRQGRGQVAVVDAVVLGEHDRREAVLVGPRRHLEAGRVLLGGRGRRDVGHAQVEAHRQHGGSALAHP